MLELRVLGTGRLHYNPVSSGGAGPEVTCPPSLPHSLATLWSSLPFRGLCFPPCLPSPISQQGLFCAEGPVTHVRKHSLTCAPPPLPIAAPMSWVSSPPAKYLCEEISVLQADMRLSVKSSQNVLSWGELVTFSLSFR